MLRTRFVVEGGAPIQIVEDETRFPLAWHELQEERQHFGMRAGDEVARSADLVRQVRQRTGFQTMIDTIEDVLRSKHHVGRDDAKREVHRRLAWSERRSYVGGGDAG